VITIN